MLCLNTILGNQARADSLSCSATASKAPRYRTKMLTSGPRQPHYSPDLRRHRQDWSTTTTTATIASSIKAAAACSFGEVAEKKFAAARDFRSLRLGHDGRHWRRRGYWHRHW